MKYSGPIESLSGLSIPDNALDFYSNRNCISCLEKESYSLENPAQVGNQTYELCSVLYGLSGKCNRYLDLRDIDVSYGVSWQSSNSMAC
jgi:hypothetical protein